MVSRAVIDPKLDFNVTDLALLTGTKWLEILISAGPANFGD